MLTRIRVLAEDVAHRVTGLSEVETQELWEAFVETAKSDSDSTDATDVSDSRTGRGGRGATYGTLGALRKGLPGRFLIALLIFESLILRPCIQLRRSPK